MKKIVFCILLIMCLCGCSAKADIVITSNNDVYEEIKIWNDWLNFKDYNESINEVIDSYKQSYNNIFEGSNYSVKYDTSNDIITATINSSNNTLDNISSSVIVQQLFKEVKTTSKNGNAKLYTLVYADETLSLFEDTLGIGGDESMFFDKIELNIQFHNVVSDANSDSYNSVTNTYTWIINEKNLDRNIEFAITNEKRYDIIIPYLLKKYIGYVIIGTLLLGILIFGLVIAYKSKRENEI